MSFDINKFERGQVWRICFKYPQEQVGREQQKDRPWLIVSINKFNTSEGMVTAVPITTRDETRTPSQVLFTNDVNVRNVILCENIRTFDWRSGSYKFEYVGTLSDEILEKVDIALSIHLGMHYSPITLNRLYNSMEAIVRGASRMCRKGDVPFTDEDVLNLAMKLEELAAPKEVVKKEESKEVVTEIKVEKKSETPKPATVSSTVDSNSSRVKWTTEKCKEFLKDTEELPMKEVMEKWNIEKKPRFYSMKHYVQGLLTK